ncbi:PiggyBac transposable element-derived protein 4 [Labeo rohita]|uniref:PiggyBac transposable element-derived protein 4 n=1 Tax=Labeo rohita TaxID=84645 RepID=A0ABQ8L506_LABRO|nr:PiggyBac transposable element-derived protein 4 [Labeo rohita]
MSTNQFKRRKLTNEEIVEIFFNSDEDFDSEADSDSDEDLPANLEALDRTEDEETSTTSAHVFAEADGTNSSSWKVTNLFNPPGPGEFNDQLCGVQNPPESPSEVNCFKMFLTEDVVKEIVEETNRYASEIQEEETKGKMVKWAPTSIPEMYTFLASVMLMGMVKKPSLRDYWSTDPMLLTPFFRSLFSQDRFLILLRCLHFANNTTEMFNDPLKKIRKVFSALTSSFRRNFLPYRDLCVDESLMKWKGRLAFRQFIPSKRNRFGVKFFVLCDVLTGYVQDMIIYSGSTTDIQHYQGLGISGSVVMTLLAPYLRKGHVLYVDNWYSSPTLFQHLLSLGTGACGTVRPNRKGMPTFTKKMTKGEVDFRENGSQLAVKWHDKRDVHVLTTVHPTGMAATGKTDHITGQPKMKPVCVLEYNKKMGAVDKADMMTGFLECTRKSTKWYKKVFFHLLDTVVLNSQIVYWQLTGKEITSMQFRINLMRGLLEEYSTSRCPSKGGRPALDTPLRLTARHFPSEVPQTTSQGSRTRRHCKVCLSSTRKSKQRRLTKYMCVPCNTPLCAVPCFEEYHTLKHY